MNYSNMLNWARLHDWGYDAEIVDGGLKVGCDLRYPDGRVSREFKVVSNMAELRNWAGY